MWILLVLVGVISAFAYFKFFSNRQKLPPGPRGIPLFGNMLQMDPLMHLSFQKWAKQYGPIYQVKLVSTRIVVINDPKWVKEMFAEQVFTGRMDFSLFDIVLNGKIHGLVFHEGEHWEELRRFTLRHLRDLGFGKSSMESLIMPEVQELIESLQRTEGKSVGNVDQRLRLAVVNALWLLITGKRYKHDDAELLKMIKQGNDAFTEIFTSGSLLLFFPYLARTFPKLTGYTRIKGTFEKIKKHFTQPIKQHKETYTEDYERDFTDAFIKEIRKTKDTNSAFYGQLGEDNLLAVITDLYFAGSDTTSTTLAWLILFLSKVPEVQRKFQQEIEEVTGNSRPCSVSDRPSMPYTEAVIAETLRYSAISATGVAHKAIRDTEFKGYFIPKDSLINPNIYAIHHDPAIWGDPENFRPERFLSPDGKTFKKHEALIAFSVGKRVCIGETLARDSLFLFATNIFQRFSVEFDTAGPDHGFVPKLTILLVPSPFNVKFRDRLV